MRRIVTSWRGTECSLAKTQFAQSRKSIDETTDLESDKGYNLVKWFPSEVIRTYHLDDVDTRYVPLAIFQNLVSIALNSICIENLFRECFVSPALPANKRAFQLLCLFDNLDAVASAAFVGMLKTMQRYAMNARTY